MQNKPRNIYFDVLKIIVSFLVVFNHTGSNAFTLFMQYEPDRIKYWIYLFIAVAGRIPIPVFLGISGALLLTRREDLKTIWKKRIGSMFMTLLVFSFLSYGWDVLEGKMEFSLVEFAKGLYSYQWNYAYWYLYAYLGFLICLPFLRALVQKLEDRDYFYLFGIVIVLNGVLPILEYFICPDVSLNEMTRIQWLATDIVSYPLLGYFMHHKLKPVNKKRFIVKMWIANLTGIFICMGATYYGMMIGDLTDGGSVQRFFESFLILNSSTVFLTVKYLLEKYSMPTKVEKVVAYLGQFTFGIYLLHPILMWQVLDEINFCRFFVVEWHMDYMPAGILFTLIMWLLSLIITMILKKIPFVKKLI